MNGRLKGVPFLERFGEVLEAAAPDQAGKAQERANAQVVREAYAALFAADVAAFAARLADDVVVEIVGPVNSPIAGRWQGREAVLAALARNFALFADQYPELERVLAQGDGVLVIAQETGRYLPTGRPYDVWWLHSFRVRDGKIAHVRQVVNGREPWE